MPQSLIHFITAYGYWAIFWLIFLQEIGVPNPVSNELVLLFAGSLGFTGLLSFPLIFLTAVFADILGATILYFVFHYFGLYLLSKKPRWIPVSEETINRLHRVIKRHGRWGVFFGRLLPFARGYAAVAAGLFDIKKIEFFMVVTASALIWSGGFVTLGMLSGKYVNQVENTTGGIEKILLIAILISIVTLVVHVILKHSQKRKLA